jgi:creatinine amidohydrolase
MTEVLMERMSWVEYRQRVEQEDPVVFLPCGSLEQHGPHLPLGVDALLSTAVACETARRVGGIVAPALSYGYKSQPRCGGGQHFPGTTSLDGDHLSQVSRDVIREFGRHGVSKVVLVDGHYENQWFLIEGIDLAMRDLGREHRMRIMRSEYWDFCSEEVLDQIFPDGFPGFALEHAAVIETSLMLHFHPGLVWQERIPDDGPAEFPPYDMYPPHTHWVPASGVLSSARGASAEKGALLVEAVCSGFAAAVRREFGGDA